MIYTYQYPYLQFSFQSFNPVQQQAYQYYDKDCNIVVSSTMASGKTTIAEMVIAFQMIQKNGNCVYVSPLCELTQQMKSKWGRYDVFKKNEDKLHFFTVQGLDVAIRKKYILNIDVLVLDQAHIIDSQSRGANAEVLIKRVTQLFHNCRIILLSGTMSNAKEIAKWIKSLNQKSTYMIQSDWRPVQNIKNVVIYQNQSDKYNKLYQLLEENCYDKIVVFVYSKNTGKQLQKKLKNVGINCCFVSADLNKTKRAKVLNMFRNGQINVLVSTSLLSQGVNLG